MVRYIKIQGNGKRSVSQLLECEHLQHQKAFLESSKIRNTSYTNLSMLFKKKKTKKVLTGQSLDEKRAHLTSCMREKGQVL